MSQPKSTGRLPKIERVSITDEAVTSIRDYITSYHRPGDRLPTEMEFKEQLGVGRSTVREALRVLQALGVVEIRSGRGAFVREPPSAGSIREWFADNTTEIGELFEVRLAIEQLAARLAVARATQRQIDQIAEIQAAFRDAVGREDNVELAMLDESLHNALIEASNNRLLVTIGRVIADALVEYRTRSFAVTENIRNAVEPHDRIVRALIARDEAAAVRAIELHLDISMQDVLRVTQQSTQQPAAGQRAAATEKEDRDV